MRKALKIGIAIVISFVLLIACFIIYVIADTREKVTDINKYEKYLGCNGIYKENYYTYNDIFPNEIPQNADVEEFCYYYYDPWDPCYLGYLVFSCEENVFEKEYQRLLSIDSSEQKYIYGATDFPYELCAVYANEYYGYIYALADKENSRLIYIELQFSNGFTDIEYKKYIPEQYLPNNFDATIKNPYRK